MNSFGNIFRVSIFGESHGDFIGTVIDNVPPGISIEEDDFLNDIKRRKSGRKGTTPRIENDLPQIISGVFNKKTTGAPLTIIFKNENRVSDDYNNFATHPRPSHTDFVAKKKFLGFNDWRGSGHFSGRITLPLVAAGVVAKKILKDVDIKAKIISLGKKDEIDDSISDAIEKNDSIGGIIETTVRNLPVGLGEPFFYSMESAISSIVFSIPGIKAVEFGAGFKAASMYGSEYNDPIINENGICEKNDAGGINGGISNGNDIVFRVAMRPAASILGPQKTYNFKTKKIEPLKIAGRHDLVIPLRVPVILEAVTAIAIADLLLYDRTKGR